MNRKWIALFSQTGTEIVEIAERLEKWPDLIITNERPDHLRVINPALEGKVVFVENKPTLEELEILFSQYEDPIITLHGWLRIMPPEICEKYNIFNGHPGLVNFYSGLKGYNSQERIVGKQAEYPFIGSVVHRVIEGVDEGEVLVYSRVNNDVQTVEQAYKVLRKTSYKAWIEFFNTVL